MDAKIEYGAGEKLVGDGVVSGGNEARIEIKTSESQNGDTKIDFADLKNSFVGMGKDELMKFANDPFWVRVRWVLFALFWLSWLGMLVGAIGIIVLAPKCTAPSPKQWYEQSPVYLARARQFGGDLKGFSRRVDYLKDLKAETVVVEDLLVSTEGDLNRVENFLEVERSLGNMDDLKELLGKMKEAGIHLLLRLTPNYSSDKHSWFLKSAEGEAPYKDYYVWAPPRGWDSNDRPNPPNNWLSLEGGSAWEYHPGRKEFYLHQFGKGQPDLNYRNPAVIEEMREVLREWLDAGVAGFYLDKLQYLVEDEGLADEGLSPVPGNIHDQYEFYTHARTVGLPASLQVVEKLAAEVSNRSGVLLTEGLGSEDARRLGQLVWQSVALPDTLVADSLQALVQARLKDPGVWDWSCSGHCQKYLPNLRLVSLLLPGTVAIRSGEELGLPPFSSFPESQQNSTLYPLTKQLIKIRDSPSLLYGDTDLHLLNQTVLVFTRIKKGNPGFLVLFNLGYWAGPLDLGELEQLPAEVNLVASPPSSSSESTLTPSKVASSSLQVPHNSFLLATFVPQPGSD